MERTHEFTLRRRSGTASKDARGKVKKPWADLATVVSGIFQVVTGKVVQDAAGRDVQVRGLLFFHPSALPAGVEAKADDVVVITSGRAPADQYRVAQANLVGERTGRWDDELVLVDSDVEDTSGS